MKQLIVPTWKLHKTVYNEILKIHTKWKWMKENLVSDTRKSENVQKEISIRKLQGNHTWE